MKIVLIGAGVLLAVLVVIFFVSRPPPPDPAMRRMSDLAELAERTCLSNTNDSTSVSLKVALDAVKKVDASGGIEQQRNSARGAAQTLSADVLRVENDAIRKCMEPWAQKIRDTVAVQ